MTCYEVGDEQQLESRAALVTSDESAAGSYIVRSVGRDTSRSAVES